MRPERELTRRTFLLGAAGLAASAVAACTSSTRAPTTSLSTSSLAQAVLPSSSAQATVDCTAGAAVASTPLWQVALDRGLVYGSSAATWQLTDGEYRSLFQREAGILFTEDDLLWWRLRPTPASGLNFKHSDEIIDFANREGMLVFGAHLVWDEGFGDGWTDDDLWGMEPQAAKDLIHTTIDAVVRRYRGKVAAWSVVNEAIDAYGVRSDVPWYATIGPSYIAESFGTAHAADPNALLV
jgi:endo-1,4-beta-xylanase